MSCEGSANPGAENWRKACYGTFRFELNIVKHEKNEPHVVERTLCQPQLCSLVVRSLRSWNVVAAVLMVLYYLRGCGLSQGRPVSVLFLVVSQQATPQVVPVGGMCCNVGCKNAGASPRGPPFC